MIQIVVQNRGDPAIRLGAAVAVIVTIIVIIICGTQCWHVHVVGDADVHVGVVDEVGVDGWVHAGHAVCGAVAVEADGLGVGVVVVLVLGLRLGGLVRNHWMVEGVESKHGEGGVFQRGRSCYLVLCNADLGTGVGRCVLSVTKT